MDSSPLKHPQVGLAFLVSQLGAHTAQAFARHLEPIGLTPQHVGILRLLATKPPRLTQNELASRLRVLPSRLVVLLDEIEARGLLLRETNPDDRRSNILRATAAGLKQFRAAEVATAALEEELFADLSAAKRAALMRTLEQLRERLGLLPGIHPSYRQSIEEQTMSQTFVASILRGNDRGEGKDTMGLVVPAEIVAALGASKRPPVIVRVGKGPYSYRSTIASMGGQFLVGVAKEHREPAGIKGQQKVEVTLTLDTQPRDTPIPKDLAKALSAAGVRPVFDKLAPSRRKEAIRQVESAKADATRARRVLKIVAEFVELGE